LPLAKPNGTANPAIRQKPHSKPIALSHFTALRLLSVVRECKREFVIVANKLHIPRNYIKNLV
jgi:hypothetical protein